MLCDSLITRSAGSQYGSQPRRADRLGVPAPLGKDDPRRGFCFVASVCVPELVEPHRFQQGKM
jgi:hypothetical protein